MKKLVILGGGYGGFKIIQTLISKGFPKDVEITLIDRNPYHSLKTEFYALAAGTIADKHIRMEFPKHNQIEYIFGEIFNINTDEQSVTLSQRKEQIPYDYLVIGLGCEDNFHGIEGAKEFTKSVQTITKAREAGLEINNLGANKNVVIVGAGLSGIEVASEIRESRPDLNISLLDRRGAVLRGFDPKIQSYVEEWFKQHDVNVIHQSIISRIEEGSVCVNDYYMESDITLWTAGVRPNQLVRELPFEKDKQEKIVVNEYYQVPEKMNIFVVGDCASSIYAPSAQLAQVQGEQIAEILHDLFSGKEARKPSSIKLKGTLGSLGKNDGFGNMFELPFTGFLPRVAKSGILWLHKIH